MKKKPKPLYAIFLNGEKICTTGDSGCRQRLRNYEYVIIRAIYA